MDRRGSPVVAIECLAGSSRAEEWNGNMLQTGDIVEEIKIGSSSTVRSPFKNGKSGIQKLLQGSFKKKETLVVVRVRRGQEEFVELQACIVPFEKKQFVLRSIQDPNYNVGFVDRTEGECLALQGNFSPLSLSLRFVVGSSHDNFVFGVCDINMIIQLWNGLLD